MAPWLLSLESVDSDAVIATAPVAENAIWFGGHFPSNPVLPGIAMLALVEETFRTFVRPRLSARSMIVAMRRVRFKHMVRPNATLRVKLVRNAERQFAFDLEADGTPACSGTFETGEEAQ